MKNQLANLLVTVFIITGLLLLELGTPVASRGETFRQGTVRSNVNLREQPSLQANILSGLLQGTPVKVYAEKDGWYRVSAKKYHQVFNGWVSRQYVDIAAEKTPARPPAVEAPESDQATRPLPPAEKTVPPAPGPVSEKPLPPPVEKSLQPAPGPAPEKPLPPPAAQATLPEAQLPAVVPEPEPEKRVPAKPPETKLADTQTRQPSRVVKRPVAPAVAEPADDLKALIPMALPVLAVIVLLIAFIVYRVRRASGPKAEKSDLAAVPAPAVWPPPPPENSPAPEESQPPPAENSRTLEESAPLEEDLTVDFEFEMESEPEDGTAGDDGASPTLVVTDRDEDESATQVAAVGDAGESATKVVAVSESGDSPTQAVSVYDQVMEKISRMSDVELVELMDRIEAPSGGKPPRDDRLTFYTTVDYVVEDQYYRDFIQDLSVSGVFIRARQMFEPGQQITMTFMSPFLQKPFKISGEIVRTLDTGIGVNFDTESQVQTEAISALMEEIRKIEASG